MTFLLLIIFIAASAVYIKLKKKFQYWERKGVKGPKPVMLLGNFKSIVKRNDSLYDLISKIYRNYPEEKYVGIYAGLTPVLIIRDPDLIKHVLIKDFATFVGRGFDIANDFLSQNMFMESGDKWRILRKLFTPLFTNYKFKQTMPILNDCVTQYVDYLDTLVDSSKQQELKSLNRKFVMKCITSISFGIDVPTFTDAKEVSKYFEIGDNIFSQNIRQILVVLLESIFPGTLKALRINILNEKTTHFFLSLVSNVMKERPTERINEDFMDILIRIRKQGALKMVRDGGNVTKMEVTDEILAGQAALFYIASFSSSAETISFFLYELVMNPDIQERCYEEVVQTMAKYGGELPFEAIKELGYLGAAFDETLRMYPGGGTLMRRCNADYTFPGTDLTLEKGTRVFIPVPSLHTDPDYFPEPEKFRPERFAADGRGKIRDCTFLPFGEGPRRCIGLQSARIQFLTVVAHILRRFRLSACERTVSNIRLDPRQLFTPVSVDDLWFNISRR